jgi:protein arginine kinase activator
MERCEDCGGDNATVHITRIVQDKTILRHLCEACARKQGIAVEPAASSGGGTDDETASCPNCGLLYKDFKETGWLGCAQCYGAFAARIEELLQQVHGAQRHTGKQYKQAAVLPRDLKQLKTVLARALKNEEYELAAAIRDTIHSLETLKK